MTRLFSVRNKAELLKALSKNQAGVTIVEFALTLPLFVGITVVGLELAYFALVNMKLNQIAVTVADNASRYTPSMDEADFIDIIAGASVIGSPINFSNNGRFILSSLQDNLQTGTNAGQMIHWQRCNGSLTSVASAYGVEGAGRTNATLATGVGSTTNKITAATGTALMFVEVVYNYQPLIAPNYAGSVPLNRRLRYEAAYVVRSRQNFNLTNTNNATINAC